MRIKLFFLLVGIIFSSSNYEELANKFSFYNFSNEDKTLYKDDFESFLNNLSLLRENNTYVIDNFTDSRTYNHHIILKQTHDNIQIFGRTARLHIDKYGIPSTFSNNFYNGKFDSSIPAINLEYIFEIINSDFEVPNIVFNSQTLIYYIKDNFGYLSYQIDAVTYSEAYRYIINAHSGDIIKKWTLIHDEGPAIGSGENLLEEWVDELHIYEGSSFTPSGDMITPYLVCEAYCFDYGDCGGSSYWDCEINPSQGICPDNYLEDCNGECFHEWYLQFPGVGNGFCNDPWIDVDEESISMGAYNMVDESNLDLGVIFTINSYGGFYEDLSYVNSNSDIFDSNISSYSHQSGVSAHDYQRKTLDYYWNHHGYAGLDGEGMRTISVVNYGSGGGISQNNAFYNAGLGVLSYGIAGGAYRPFCAAQDIVTHEFTHGFTAYTSGLIYENQPGAMNESMSDVFGYFVEAEYQDGGDWTEGEDIRINGGASRSFSNPPTYGDPDNINHPYYVPFANNPTFANDNGGVHSNSGITNKILYLVVQGDEHYDIEVEPLDENINISRNIASDIWYNWNKYYLDAEDDFTTGREKMLQVAIDLYPIDSTIYQTISNAWASVGIGMPLLSGDVNFDSVINIQDIIILINFIIGNDIPDEEELHSGDINFDGIIDILDIVQIINIIFN